MDLAVDLLNGILALAALYAIVDAALRVGARMRGRPRHADSVGWAFAQFPFFLLEPDVDIFNASAPPVTLKILTVALAAGAAVLLPSYQYLLKIFKSRPKHRHFRMDSAIERDPK